MVIKAQTRKAWLSSALLAGGIGLAGVAIVSATEPKPDTSAITQAKQDTPTTQTPTGAGTVAQAPPTPAPDTTGAAAAAVPDLSARSFGGGGAVPDLSARAFGGGENRTQTASAPSASVATQNDTLRAPTDVGDLLGKSQSTQGVEIQHRNAAKLAHRENRE